MLRESCAKLWHHKHEQEHLAVKLLGTFACHRQLCIVCMPCLVVQVMGPWSSMAVLTAVAYCLLGPVATVLSRHAAW